MVLSVLVGLINLFNLTFCLLAAPKLYYLYCSSVLSGSHFQSRVLNEAKNLCRIFYDGIIQITRWMFAVQLHLLLCHCCYTMMLLLAACDIKFTLTVCHSLSSLTVVIKTKVWISVLVCTNNAAVPSCPTITPLLSGVSCLSLSERVSCTEWCWLFQQWVQARHQSRLFYTNCWTRSRWTSALCTSLPLFSWIHLHGLNCCICAFSYNTLWSTLCVLFLKSAA